LKAGPLPSSNRKLGRRGFLARLAAASLALPFLGLPSARAEDPPPLDPNDPTAKTIGYTEDASKVDPKTEPLFKPNSRCTNCTFFQTAQAKGENAPCTIFANRIVVGKGWCRAWSAKPQ
jgi:High potential iron-sulfur protein